MHSGAVLHDMFTEKMTKGDIGGRMPAIRDIRTEYHFRLKDWKPPSSTPAVLMPDATIKLVDPAAVGAGMSKARLEVSVSKDQLNEVMKRSEAPALPVLLGRTRPVQTVQEHREKNPVLKMPYNACVARPVTRPERDKDVNA